MITVGLADDQPLVRTGFAMVLDSQPNMTVLWHASDGVEAVAKCQSEPVDVVLMDVQMPKLDGISATREILSSQPDIRIIMLTTFENEEYVLGAIDAGASGFLLKDSEPEDLISAVLTIDESSAVISPKATASLMRSMRSSAGNNSTETESASKTAPAQPSIVEGADSPDLVEPLTPRECEILRLMARGLSNQEIVAELYVSMPTVKTHVSHILRKTGSRDRVHAVLFAIHHGLD